MKSDIQNYQVAEGLSDEAMAERISANLGRTVSVQGYRIVKGRKDAPRPWLEALNIAPNEPSPGSDTPPVASTASVSDDGAPRQDGNDVGVTVRPGVLPFEPASAAMQITLIYTMAGKGAAMAMQAPPVAEVWAQHAPQIAGAYIDWARENAAVAKWIQMLTLGGPAGNLVYLHGSLLVSSLIIANKIKADSLVPPPMRMPEETDLIGGTMPPSGEFPTDDAPPETETDEPKPRKPRARR